VSDRPRSSVRPYDRGEIIADATVHALGTVFGTGAVLVLVVSAAGVTSPWEMASVVVYGVALLSVLTVSAVYNLWPVSPMKELLRRLDHSAIYLLIAGTYTPFISQMKASLETAALLVGVWATSLVGMTLKLMLPGRFDRLSILLYLLIGWSGILAYEAVLATLPSRALGLIALGGLLYTLGVVFHLWESLRFQNAIWHGFVLAAAGCHYGAVLQCMVLGRV
jgi:hemolysin III